MNCNGLSVGAVACLLVASAPTAQRYQQVYGSREFQEQALAVDNTPCGGYVTTGYTQFGGAAAADLLVTRYDAVGNVIWSRRYDGDLDERGYSIRTLSDGYIVAGTIAGGQPRADEILVARLDPVGNVIWSRRYAGTAGTDLVNVPDPGVSIVVQAGETGFIVVANRFGRPSTLRLAPNGALSFARDYQFYNPANYLNPELEVGFTDLVEITPGAEYALVGTAREFSAAAPNGDRAVILVAVDAQLNPFAAFLYNATRVELPGTPVDETGDGIDLDPGRQLLQIAGRVEIGDDGGFVSTMPHLLTIDRASLGGIAGWTHYKVIYSPNDPRPISWETGYAAVDYDAATDLIGVGGLWDNPGGLNAGMLEFFGHGLLNGARSYASNDRFGLDAPAVAAGEDIVKGKACGWLVAGRNDLANFVGLPGPFMTPPLGEYIVKTNDGLWTGCFEDDVPLERPDIGIRFNELQWEIASRDEVAALQFNLVDLSPSIDTLCRDTNCDPCPCPGDIDGDNDVDGDDFVLFLVHFGKFYDNQCNVIPGP